MLGHFPFCPLPEGRPLLAGGFPALLVLLGQFGLALLEIAPDPVMPFLGAFGRSLLRSRTIAAIMLGHGRLGCLRGIALAIRHLCVVPLGPVVPVGQIDAFPFLPVLQSRLAEITDLGLPVAHARGSVTPFGRAAVAVGAISRFKMIGALVSGCQVELGAFREPVELEQAGIDDVAALALEARGLAGTEAGPRRVAGFMRRTTLHLSRLPVIPAIGAPWTASLISRRGVLCDKLC
ncbi:MAG: hypothetical protein GY873_02575 [Bosea sp.]|uniref:hypothetical protein n=1 Tax=Bosea sp. (in: a-proteobacteria) TaxID=1871050 RepID=UPI002396A81A|nr:hypothetical protein [Bosea sp. (in: a-proteobacteria)]MCP4733054.1 hypothetical protein [Bosea sp. (in: a-proteobacteria)]